MVGAEDATFARIEAMLHAMGTTIHRCGAPGMGTRMKVVNNFIALSISTICAEGIALGTKLGLDIDLIHDVTADTTARNAQLHLWFPAKVLKGDIEPGFTTDLAFKDMGLAIAAAADVRMGLPVGSAAYAAYSAARSSKYAAKDCSAILEFACESAGIDTPRLQR